MKKWECIICGLIYDEAEGWPDDGIAPGTANELLIVEAIHMTVTGTGAAIHQFLQCALGSPCEFTTTVQRQVGRLKTLKRETLV